MGTRKKREIGTVMPTEIIQFVESQMTGVKADCLFSSCTNWRAMLTLALQARFGISVISSNQATMEAARALGLLTCVRPLCKSLGKNSGRVSAMADILILNRGELEELLTLETMIPEIERAFVAFSEGRTKAYPVVRETIPHHRGIFGIKSGYLMDEEVVGLKAGGFWLDNPSRGLTAHQSTTLMFDPKTGQPTALMDGNHITTIRTAAVGALAARCLSREDSKTAAVLGCGTQGTAQAEALCHVRAITEIHAYDVKAENLEKFAKKLQGRGIDVQPMQNAEQAVSGADVVITATPGIAPVLRAAWVGAGMHISAFGTDTVGKVEVEPALFQRVTVVVDDLDQSTTIGETQHAVAQGLIGRDDINATLGEILAGKKAGRSGDDEITLFDATGLAFQDLIAGHLATRLARKRGLGQTIRIS